MSLAFVGAHRTGKSTLADAFAQQAGVPFVQTGASEVFNILGLDPKAEYPIERRISIQAAILRAFEAQWSDAARRSTFFVSDRSPLDLASYLLADVSRQTLAGRPEVAAAVTDYVRACIESANRFFHTIILVQPGIPLVEEKGKAPACPAYMAHLNAIMLGLLGDERLQLAARKMPRAVLALDQRVRAVFNTLQGVVEQHDALVGRLIRKGEIVQH